jgi:hypothetical protein
VPGFPADVGGPKSRKNLPEFGGFGRPFEPCKGEKATGIRRLSLAFKFANEAHR